MKRVYLYLGKRDKKGIKVLAVLKGEDHHAVRIADIKKLGLPQSLEQNIERQVYTNRMLWELWAESAESFGKLKEALRNRGYSMLPLCSNPAFELERDAIAAKVNHLKPKPIIKTIEKEPVTMVRKNGHR